jgi:SHS2 domain-containing protein
MRSYEISDRFTTADIGVELTGDSFKELLMAGIEGMMAVIFGNPPTGQEQKVLFIELQAEDREQLLVDWLSEILYHFDTGGWIPINTVVELSDDPYHIKAKVGCRLYDRKADKAEHEIKAVTYHKLEIRNTDGIYSCHLVFDL